jgi:hypothetical protein
MRLHAERKALGDTSPRRVVYVPRRIVNLVTLETHG